MFCQCWAGIAQLVWHWAFIRISTLLHLVVPHLQTSEPLVQGNQKHRRGQWGRWRCKWLPEDGRRGEIGFSYTTLNMDLSHAVGQRWPSLAVRRGAGDVCGSCKGMGQQAFPDGGSPESHPHTPPPGPAAGIPPGSALHSRLHPHPQLCTAPRAVCGRRWGRGCKKSNKKQTSRKKKRKKKKNHPPPLGGGARRQGAISWQLPLSDGPAPCPRPGPRLCPELAPRPRELSPKCEFLPKMQNSEEVDYLEGGGVETPGKRFPLLQRQSWPRALGWERPLKGGSHPSHGPGQGTAAVQTRWLLGQPLGHKARNASAAPGGPAFPLGRGGIFWQNTLQVNKCQFVKHRALTTVKSGGVLVTKSLSNHSFAAYARWENSQLGNWILLRSSSMSNLSWQCCRKVYMTNHGNSGQTKREGKIKVLVSSCQAVTVLCSSPQSAWLTFRETIMAPKLRKWRRWNEFSSFIPSMVLKCGSRTESFGAFVSELIVLDLLSHWSWCNESQLTEYDHLHLNFSQGMVWCCLAWLEIWQSNPLYLPKQEKSIVTVSTTTSYV